MSSTVVCFSVPSDLTGAVQSMNDVRRNDTHVPMTSGEAARYKCDALAVGLLRCCVLTCKHRAVCALALKAFL